MSSNLENIELHFKYCMAFALLAIVMIATERWSESQQFTTYLSNATTMTSLILAVIAIFYSFISNDSLARSLGSISTISSEVQGVRGEIERYSGLMKDAAVANAENESLLRKTSETVSENLGFLQNTLRAISEQNATLQGLVATLPNRIDQLESKVGDVAKALGEKPANQQASALVSDISARAVDHFLMRATLVQNLLTYACVLSANSKIPLSLFDFGKAVGFDAPSNFNGFLNCMHSIELIDRKAVTEREKVYNILAIHPEIERQTRLYFVEYIERTYSNKPTEYQDWMSKFSGVEGMFLR